MYGLAYIFFFSLTTGTFFKYLFLINSSGKLISCNVCNILSTCPLAVLFLDRRRKLTKPTMFVPGITCPLTLINFSGVQEIMILWYRRNQIISAAILFAFCGATFRMSISTFGKGLLLVSTEISPGCSIVEWIVEELHIYLKNMYIQANFSVLRSNLF